MLRPDDRTHLLELLRPPAGYRFDRAVGTTFSLDLLSALTVPLSFALFDWEEEDGRPSSDPMAMLEALSRYGERFDLFCQAGQIYLPRLYPPLITFLEHTVHEVHAPKEHGVFHPKVWALRFLSTAGEVVYRVLCLSRNLTFDRSWDTVVALDGILTNRSRAIAANNPLGSFFDALPGLTLRKLPPNRKKAIQRMAWELRRTRFEWPEGFAENDCRFWVSGLDEREVDPFGKMSGKRLVVSPFLSESVVQRFLKGSDQMHLVSRPECLRNLSRETLKACASVHFLAHEANAEADEEDATADRNPKLEGLHAKLFLIDRGWNTSVFTGSFNATEHALRHNVEFMIELVGKRSQFGVEKFLEAEKGETGFADLLRRYDPELASEPEDPAIRRLDEFIQATKILITKGKPKLEVVNGESANQFDLRLIWKRPPRWPEKQVEVRTWPITQAQGRSQALTESVMFSRISFEGLTPFFAFSIQAAVGGREGESLFVMNLPVEGMPEDRADRVLASLVSGKELRFLLFLLASGDDESFSPGDLAKILGDESKAVGLGSAATLGLLEIMVRALHRNPAQIERVASLVECLKKAESRKNESILLGAKFQRIWEPIWEVVREIHEANGPSKVS